MNTRQDILIFYEGLNLCRNITGVEYDPEFTYSLSINIRELKNEYESIVSAVESRKKDFEAEKKAFAEENCERDELGNCIIENGIYKFAPEKQKLVNEKILELETKYKKELSENKEFLKGESKVEIYKVKNSDFPKMNPRIADMLFLMREPKEKE